jgi:hypothetical protein
MVRNSENMSLGSSGSRTRPMNESRSHRTADLNEEGFTCTWPWRPNQADEQTGCSREENQAESLAARNKSRVAATLPSKLRPRHRIHERNKNALATGRMHDHQSRGTDPRPSTAAEGLNQPTKMEQWQLKLIKQRERIQR